jgi:hypothetical protein
MWKHKECGGEVTSELRYSDSDNDYYFAVCEKCQTDVETKDMYYEATTSV